jgi:lysophospholipase
MTGPPPRIERFAAADGTLLRTGLWDGRGRGTAILFGGRSEFLEKYAETAGDLASRGFTVLSFDWRGQGLSGRPAGAAPRGHLADFAPLLDDAERLLTAVALPALPRPFVLLAHSMGAQIGLRLAARRPAWFAAAILTAPMIEPVAVPWQRAVARAGAGLVMRFGGGARYVPGFGPYDAATLRRVAAQLTGDPARGAILADAFARDPALRIDGLTWGWLDAAFASARALYRVAPAIPCPVLMVKAGIEILVANDAVDRIAALLPHTRVITYAESRHEILMERDGIRERFWADVDGFLAEMGL